MPAGPERFCAKCLIIGALPATSSVLLCCAAVQPNQPSPLLRMRRATASSPVYCRTVPSILLLQAGAAWYTGQDWFSQQVQHMKTVAPVLFISRDELQAIRSPSRSNLSNAKMCPRSCSHLLFSSEQCFAGLIGCYLLA